MARSGMILTPAHRWWVYGTFAVVYLSGVSWIVFHLFCRVQTDFAVEPSAGERVSLVLHGIAAMPFLLVLGSLIPTHLAAGWAAGRNLRTGVSMAVINLVLLATAAGLYYLGSDSLRTVASLVHQMLGAAIGLLLVVHVRWRPKSVDKS